MTAPSGSARLRPWQRLGVRLAALFAVVTLLAVVLVGQVVYGRQKRELEDAVGTQLLNIARVGVLVVDPAAHARLQASPDPGSAAYARVRQALLAMKTETLLPSPVYTISAYDAASGQARLVVTTDDMPTTRLVRLAPEVREPLGWTFEDGVARFTRVYRNATGTWITAFGPIPDAAGRTSAVLVVDYPVEVYLDRLHELQVAIVQASVVGALAALLVGFVVARRITRPVAALTSGVARVGGGDLSQEIAVTSKDEIGALTHAFNGMLEGLRQRDFIRDTFGRYVSPEVARTLLESPEGLRFGGEKRVVTILMSDLRGYTRFAEQGDPAWVMEVLNGFLARMTDVIIAHGGTINEFIGDAIFAIFGAPLAHPDHAERAAAAALAMQAAMAEVNAEHEARGLPRFELGIGVNTGEAVVGNIGSAQRAKYAVVGSAVNVAARIEGCTVGGQIFLSAATYEAVRALVEVAPPLAVEVKGLSAPLVLHDLRAIGGRWAQRLPETPAEQDRQISVALPARCWVLDGKTIAAEALEGTVVRLGRRRVDLRLSTPLAPLTNVRLRIAYPEPGHESGDLYGKVAAAEAGADGGTPIRLTSVDAGDRRVIDMLLDPGPRAAGAGGEPFTPGEVSHG